MCGSPRNSQTSLKRKRRSAALTGRVGTFAALFVALLITGCPQRMANQPRLEPQEESAFFDNHMASRQLVPGTVPQRIGNELTVAHSLEFETGMVDGQWVTTLPPEMNAPHDLRAVLERGQGRYEIFCSHCHDLVGSGHGMVPQRGFPDPPTFHSERLRAMPLGEMFRIISDGKEAMPAHRGQVPARDRWAIAAYVRALQFSQHASVADLQQSDIQRLEEAAP